MSKIKHFSISQKLTWMNMLVSGAALLLACAAFLTYDLYVFRTSIVRNLSIQAQMIGSNSVSALTFDDPLTAEKTLSALKASPRILYAEIYTLDGKPFAGYRRDQTESALPLRAIPAAETQIHWYENREI